LIYLLAIIVMMRCIRIYQFLRQSTGLAALTSLL